MKLQYMIYDTYNAFLADRDVVTFTANIKGVKKFTTYSDAYVYGQNLLKDGKLTGGMWYVLALPILN